MTNNQWWVSLSIIKTNKWKKGIYFFTKKLAPAHLTKDGDLRCCKYNPKSPVFSNKFSNQKKIWLPFRKVIATKHLVENVLVLWQIHFLKANLKRQFTFFKMYELQTNAIQVYTYLLRDALLIFLFSCRKQIQLRGNTL